MDNFYENYPGNTMEGAKRWIEDGILPGDFLTAVLRNDLTEAFARADDGNLRLLNSIVKWWYNEAPGGCWGSRERVDKWRLHQGLHGLDRKER